MEVTEKRGDWEMHLKVGKKVTMQIRERVRSDRTKNATGSSSARYRGNTISFDQSYTSLNHASQWYITAHLLSFISTWSMIVLSLLARALRCMHEYIT